eukprot:8532455-Pyramimonas_sp.AAC.1
MAAHRRGSTLNRVWGAHLLCCCTILQLSDIAGAALPFGIRLGTGGFTSGYSIGLGPNDEYAPNSPHSPRLIKPDL